MKIRVFRYFCKMNLSKVLSFIHHSSQTIVNFTFNWTIRHRTFRFCYRVKEDHQVPNFRMTAIFLFPNMKAHPLIFALNHFWISYGSYVLVIQEKNTYLTWKILQIRKMLEKATLDNRFFFLSLNLFVLFHCS